MIRLRIALFAAFGLAAPALFAAEGSFHRTLTVSGNATIEVQSGSGEINVHAGEAGKVEITGHVRSSNSFFGGAGQDRVDRIVNAPPIEQSGSWVRIGKLHDDSRFENVSISYDVVVPRESRLKLNTGSGSIVVHDAAELDAQTGSGAIEATEVAGNARVSTGSGRVMLAMAGDGDARVQVGSGNISVENARGGLNVSTGSGSVRVSGSPGHEWTIHTGSGGVDLHVGRESKMNLYARSSSGSVHSDLPVTISGTMERHTLRGSVNGGGASVRVETGSGNIDIH